MDKVPKKRGRKPKNSQKVDPIIDNKITPIIAHLPINLGSEENNDDKDLIINGLKKEIKELKKKIVNKETKVSVYNVNTDNDTSCWWCKHPYKGDKVELYTKYYDGVFYGYGCFCSFECREAYNIDLNDEEVFKRSSLSKFHYYKTFGEFKNIKKADDWKILKAFGGNVSINEFRNNFLEKNDYKYLKPPMISLHTQIEKNNVNVKIETDELKLKRSKPIKSSKQLLTKFLTIN